MDHTDVFLDVSSNFDTTHLSQAAQISIINAIKLKYFHKSSNFFLEADIVKVF